MQIKKLNSNSGFTFIELLVVIVLIIVIAGLSIPSILNYQRKQAENEEVKNFISTFRTTQNLALTTDNKYSMNFAGLKVTTCSVELNECKETNYDFISGSSTSNFFIDRYGNLVDQNNNLISVTINFPSFNVIINKFGRIYAQSK